MSGVATTPPPEREMPSLPSKGKRRVIIALFLAVVAVVGVIFGSDGKNTEFKPQDEFKLDPWVSIHLGPFDMSLNKAVLYVLLASVLTAFTMIWISRRLQQRPNRVQTAVELMYGLMRDNVSGPQNISPKVALKWFPFIGALFLFILYSNLIGLIPLPTNTLETVNVFGMALPSFSLYAATANISVTLALTLMVWFSYNFEGIRDKGFIGYLKSWVPAGVTGAAAIPIFFIEVISHFVRIISLSVRLFANLLAGHLLILFMGGGLAVLLGLSALGALTLPVAMIFFVFELGIGALQAFIFATLTAIYLGGATAESH